MLSAGFKAQYHHLTLMVVLDFDQWKILMQGPGVLVDGGREHDRTSAEAKAREIAELYLREERRRRRHRRSSGCLSIRAPA